MGVKMSQKEWRRLWLQWGLCAALFFLLGGAAFAYAVAPRPSPPDGAFLVFALFLLASGACAGMALYCATQPDPYG